LYRPSALIGLLLKWNGMLRRTRKRIRHLDDMKDRRPHQDHGHAADPHRAGGVHGITGAQLGSGE
jgi:hypothetical protein